MRTTQYAIKRIGSNGANQSMTHEMWVAIMDGIGRSAKERMLDACETATLNGVNVYTNQRLEAVPLSRLSAEDYGQVLEADAIRQEQEAEAQEFISQFAPQNLSNFGLRDV